MTPFVEAIPILESLPTVEELMKVHGLDHADARRMLTQCAKQLVFKNDVYQVAMSKFEHGEKYFGCPVIHLSIKRIDREPIHDWRDLQQIKNELTSPDFEAIELYPAEERKVDSANQYHLWVLASKDVRVPIGFTERLVDDRSVGQSKNRPLEEHQK